jgi:hypothetical protein
MAKKVIKSGSSIIVKRDRKISPDGKSKRKKSAHDGFSLEIPPKKPIKTKPKNDNEKK